MVPSIGHPTVLSNSHRSLHRPTKRSPFMSTAMVIILAIIPLPLLHATKMKELPTSLETALPAIKRGKYHRLLLTLLPLPLPLRIQMVPSRTPRILLFSSLPQPTKDSYADLWTLAHVLFDGLTTPTRKMFLIFILPRGTHGTLPSLYHASLTTS